MNTALSTGSRLWAELHAHAREYPDRPTAGEQQKAREWMTGFARRVRGMGCTCWQHWEVLLKRCPPELENRATYYWWTVAVHDAVNQRLGKPLLEPERTLRHVALRSAQRA